MEIILKKPVRKLGKVGDVVKVKQGYGRNYLLPKAIAIRASKENINQFDSNKQELAVKNDENKKLAEAAAKQMEGKTITFISQAAADGRLFGSVSHKLIASELAAKTKLPLNYSNIMMDNVIKVIGIHNVEIAYHPEVHGNIKVIVARSDSEASDLILESSKSNS